MSDGVLVKEEDAKVASKAEKHNQILQWAVPLIAQRLHAEMSDEEPWDIPFCLSFLESLTAALFLVFADGSPLANIDQGLTLFSRALRERVISIALKHGEEAAAAQESTEKGA